MNEGEEYLYPFLKPVACPIGSYSNAA